MFRCLKTLNYESVSGSESAMLMGYVAIKIDVKYS